MAGPTTIDDEDDRPSIVSTVPPPAGETSSYEAKTRVGGPTDEMLRVLHDNPEEGVEGSADGDVPRRVRKIVVEHGAQGGLSASVVIAVHEVEATEGTTDQPAAVIAVATHASEPAPAKRRTWPRMLIVAVLALVAGGAVVLLRYGGVSHVRLLSAFPWIEVVK